MVQASHPAPVFSPRAKGRAVGHIENVTDLCATAVARLRLLAGPHDKQGPLRVPVSSAPRALYSPGVTSWPSSSIVIATLVLLTGCSDVEKALNRGGDTPCSEYISQDQDTKRVTITKFVKQTTGEKNEPAGTVVDATLISVDLLCGTQRNAETPIKNADVAGIFINK